MSIHFKTGDQVETTVEKIAFGGEGVGRIGGWVLFVPFAAEGDKLRVRITSVKKNYGRGVISEILSPSPFRVHPRCSHFARCGGCHYQHISYDRQLLIKRTQVLDAFERIGRLASAPVHQCIACEPRYHYRGKAEFHAGFERGRPVLGFMTPAGSRPIDIDRCEILDDSINRAYSEFRARVQEEKLRPSREELVFWSDQDSGSPKECPKKESGAPKMVSRQAKGRTFLVPYSGFFQANLRLIDSLVDTVMNCGQPGEKETVVDCFSGSGLFSLFAADRCCRVYGVEIDPDAVGCAALNARAAGSSNAIFEAGPVETVLSKFKKEGVKPDLIIVDPPRTGCGQAVIAAIIDLSPERLVYVSCDPGTQARDIARLVQSGFCLDRVQPIDMFPQTKHIEIVASLSKGGSRTS